MKEADFSTDNRWMLPEGVGELLPPEALALEQLRRQVLDTYWSWGYELVFPPVIEYLDSNIRVIRPGSYVRCAVTMMRPSRGSSGVR
jgi:hypothetical protein